MKTKDFISSLNVNDYYVLDTTRDGLSNLIVHGAGDVNYERYCYNVRRYSKLVEGGVFLYRQPKRSSKNRKFYFFGGGVVKRIRTVGTDGNVEVDICNPFRLVSPVYEDDPRLDTMQWTTKTKKPGSWEHFWNQYGMNKISKDEFYSIIGDEDCVNVVEDDGKTAIDELTNENTVIPASAKKPEDFEGIYTKSGHTEKNTKSAGTRKTGARKTDFDALNKKKKTVGTLGEILVYNDEVDRVADLGVAKEVDHKAVTEGDGLGYDILSYDDQGNKIYIEVKTTESNKPEGFYLTPKEKTVCESNPAAYKLYRVYNLNKSAGTYNVEVYTGTELLTMFDLIPVSYIAKRK